jgi:hypothetical protein
MARVSKTTQDETNEVAESLIFSLELKDIKVSYNTQ